MSEDSTRCVVHDYWYYYKDSCPFCDVARKDATIASLKAENAELNKRLSLYDCSDCAENAALREEVEVVRKNNTLAIKQMHEVMDNADKIDGENTSLREEVERLKAANNLEAAISDGRLDCYTIANEEHKKEIARLRTRAEQAEKDVTEARGMCDLYVDEFHRIAAITDNSEIKGLCERAVFGIKQRVPIIEQRDRLEKELAAERGKVEKQCELIDFYDAKVAAVMKWRESAYIPNDSDENELKRILLGE